MIYAMSDIHGCLNALREKLVHVDLSGDNKMIFLGDYIDYGPQSGQVLRFIYELQQKHGPKKVIVLKGNHEAMLLEWINEFDRKHIPIAETMAYDSWLRTDASQGYKAFSTFVSEGWILRIFSLYL